MQLLKIHVYTHYFVHYYKLLLRYSKLILGVYMTELHQIKINFSRAFT